ncbi:MAG: tyrosine-type recombinase/integrase, partial [Acidobacteriota bacterium]
YRRHLRTCRHRTKGQNFAGCQCPIWVDGILNGKRYRRAAKTTDWQKALRKLAALESVGEDKTSKTLIEALTAWDSYLVTQRLRDSTLRKYRRLARQFSTWCDEQGYVLLTQITVEVLDSFRASRKKIAASTSAKELEILRAMFAFCNKRRWCAENPAKDIKAPKIPPNDVVPYTREEIASIFAACEQLGQESYERLRARAVLLLMRHTGLRISDALMLRRDQVRNGEVMLFTKKTSGHILLPIPTDVLRSLECLPLPEAAKHDTGYFFWGGRSDPQTLITDVSRALKSVFDKSEVKNAHAHRFRHTLATEILGGGGTMGHVADVLGISEHVARKHYAKWSRQRQEQVRKIMYAIQSEPQPELEKSGTSMVHGHSSRVN